MDERQGTFSRARSQIMCVTWHVYGQKNTSEGHKEDIFGD